MGPYVCLGSSGGRCIATLVEETETHKVFRLDNGDVVKVEHARVLDRHFMAKDAEFEYFE